MKNFIDFLMYLSTIRYHNDNTLLEDLVLLGIILSITIITLYLLV